MYSLSICSHSRSHNTVVWIAAKWLRQEAFWITHKNRLVTWHFIKWKWCLQMEILYILCSQRETQFFFFAKRGDNCDITSSVPNSYAKVLSGGCCVVRKGSTLSNPNRSLNIEDAAMKHSSWQWIHKEKAHYQTLQQSFSAQCSILASFSLLLTFSGH